MRLLGIAAVLMALTDCRAGDGASPPAAPERPQRLERTWTGQPVRMPSQVELLQFTLTLQPGARLPVHRHPYPRIGEVLSGTIRVVQSSTGRSRLFGTGETIVESIDDDHYGEVVGDAPVVLRVRDHVPPGVTSNTILHEAG